MASYYENIIKDSGLSPVEAADLQAKFDAITKAEYDKQRTDLQSATNKYYNQLYNTQQTTMDTIRQANAQAVASGASRGIQAANELSALLGLQSEAVTGATDLANQATTLAQDESQAMLENMLNAEQEAASQNQALAQILTQAGSVDVEKINADTAKQQVLQQYWDKYLQAVADNNTKAAQTILEEMQKFATQSTAGPSTGTGDTTQTPDGTPSDTTETPQEPIVYDKYTQQLNEAKKRNGDIVAIADHIAKDGWGYANDEWLINGKSYGEKSVLWGSGFLNLSTKNDLRDSNNTGLYNYYMDKLNNGDVIEFKGHYYVKTGGKMRGLHEN